MSEVVAAGMMTMGVRDPAEKKETADQDNASDYAL